MADRKGVETPGNHLENWKRWLQEPPFLSTENLELRDQQRIGSPYNKKGGDDKRLRHSAWKVAYQGARAAVCKRPEAAWYACEMDGFVKHSAKPLYNQESKCKKLKDELDSCVRHVL